MNTAYIMIFATVIAVATYTQKANANNEFKHGFSINTNIGSTKGDISGKHLDYENFVGTNPQAITAQDANILDGLIDDSWSFGYNLRYIPQAGLGYEVGIYKTKTKLPTQDAALKHNDGSAFKQNTLTGPIDVVVASPSSEIETVDIYLGGIYRFTAVNGITPYVGAGYAKTKGKWNNSYYSGEPGDDPEYGTRGETDVKGNYKSLKGGVDFNNGWSVELERSNHEFYAEAFRSFNISGSDTDYDKTSIGLLWHF